MKSKTMNVINIGDVASIKRTITEADVHAFATVTGDFNPIHMDDEYARGTVFGGRISHGVLSIGLISNVIGNQLPGPGSIYMKQSCKFIKPVFLGDTITATVEVIEKDIHKNRVKLRTFCTNQNGEITLDGEALTMLQ